MKNAIISLGIFLGPIIAFGQEVSMKRNSVYFEAFGQGLYNSFSYDRLYHIDKKVKTSFTAGLTIIPVKELFVLGTPLSYNFLFGQKNHHLELGLGITVLRINHGRIQVGEGYYDTNGILQYDEYIGTRTEYYSYFTPKVGYRFQKPNGGVFFRVTLTPPVAGVNRIGPINESRHYRDAEYEYFSSAAFFGYRVFPWAGLSVGYTLK